MHFSCTLGAVLPGGGSAWNLNARLGPPWRMCQVTFPIHVGSKWNVRFSRTLGVSAFPFRRPTRRAERAEEGGGSAHAAASARTGGSTKRRQQPRERTLRLLRHRGERLVEPRPEGLQKLQVARGRPLAGVGIRLARVLPQDLLGERVLPVPFVQSQIRLVAHGPGAADSSTASRCPRPRTDSRGRRCGPHDGGREQSNGTRTGGQVWNGAEFGRAFGVSHTTVRRYLDLLTSVFVVRQLQPWFENISKRQVRSPKVYIADSGILLAVVWRRFSAAQAYLLR